MTHVGEFHRQQQAQRDLAASRVAMFRATVTEVDGVNRMVRLRRDGSSVAESQWRPVIVGTMPVVNSRVYCIPLWAADGQTPDIVVIGR